MATQDSNGAQRCPRLSVAMVVRDAEGLLERSIDSVRPIADEVVVLDTGSSDGTPALACRLGARLASAPWRDDFSEARNRCLRMAKGDWILWLDAGETLDPSSAPALREFIDASADPSRVYLIPVEAPPREPGTSAEQVAQPRLMPRRHGLRFEGRVRETVKPSAQAIGLIVGAAPGRIHLPVEFHDPIRRAAKARRNLDLAALEAADRGWSPRLHLAVGDARFDLGWFEPAQQAYRAAIDAAPRGSIEMLEGYYGLAVSLAADPFLRHAESTAYLEALQVYPFDAQLLLGLGHRMQELGRTELAARAFRAAVDFGQVEIETWHLKEVAEVAACCLSLALQLCEQPEDARRALAEALDRHGDSLRVVRRAIDFYVARAETDAALALVDRLAADAAARDRLAEAVRGACLAAAGEWTPALGRLQSAYLAGCRDAICLRWLVLTFMAGAQRDAARNVLDEWLRLEPQAVEPSALRNALDAESAPAEPPAESPVEPPDRAADALPPRRGRVLRVDPATTVLDVQPIVSTEHLHTNTASR